MKAFIIRLKDNEHSCQMARDCKLQAEKFGIQVDYFDAVNGKDAAEHYSLTNIKPKKKFKKGRLGVLGCFFSHYYLWKKCLNDNVPYIILEHDGYFIREFPESLLDSFDDVLKLDRHDPYSKNYNQIVEEENVPLSVEKYINPAPKNPVKLGTGNYFKGAYSYVIKPSGAHKLLEHINLNGHLPADQQIGDWVVDTRTTVPTLARLHPFYAESDNIKTTSLTGNDHLLF